MSTISRILQILAVATLITALLAVAQPVGVARRVAETIPAPKTNAERLARGLTPLRPRNFFGPSPAGGQSWILFLFQCRRIDTRCSPTSLQAVAHPSIVVKRAKALGNRDGIKVRSYT
jgi:hypothetical protein